MRSKNQKIMKKFTSFLILTVFSLIFVACGGESKKENDTPQTENNKTNETKKFSVEIPAEGDYVQIKAGGIERVFTVKPQTGNPVNNIEDFGNDNNLLRIERHLSAENNEERITIELFNFDLKNFKTPLSLRANNAKQRVDIRYIFKNQAGQNDFYKAVDNFVFTIEKVEGDVFEGVFSGAMTFSTETVKAEGKFRMKMIDNLNNKKPV